MSLPAYPEYKESNSQRLGMIPNGWKLLPCRAVVEECTEKNADASIQNYLSLMANVGIIKYEDKGDVGNKKPEDLSKCKIVRKGDLVINSMNYGIGSYGLSPLNGVCSSVYIILRPVKSVVSVRYVLRIFEEKEFQARAQSFGNGILAHRSAIGWDDLKNIDVAIPPIEEQELLAHFLDYEIAKIDTLIHEQKRLIELLQEKRQAVISHAVTKGLDPNVPMRDSGVEWLGEVPAHWQISKLSHYANLLTGFPFPSSSFSQDDSDVRLLRGANVGVSILKWENTVYWDLNKDDSLSKYEMPEAQIVIGMDRPWIGRGLRIARVTKKDMPCLLLQRVAAITATEFLDDNYLFSILQSGAFKVYVEPDLTGVSIPHLSPEQILGFTVPIPPIEEQILVFSYINEQIERNGALLEQVKFSIRLLEERRSALISAAVTGKIDVRNWQPPADESAFDEEMRQAEMKVTA